MDDDRRKRRIGPGRTLLGFLVFYVVGLGALALAGYGAGHLASRSLGRPGEVVAAVLFFAALGATTIASAVVVASRTAEASDPWWSAGLGFLAGVLAAAYVRLKHYLVER